MGPVPAACCAPIDESKTTCFTALASMALANACATRALSASTEVDSKRGGMSR